MRQAPRRKLRQHYLRRYTTPPIRVIIWLSMFLQILEERMSALPGVMLENSGRLLFTDVTI
jgi:hypothetical protein